MNYILELTTVHLNLYTTHRYLISITHRSSDTKVTLRSILSKTVKSTALPGLPGGPGGPLSPGGPVSPVPMQLKHVSPGSPKKICIEKAHLNI